MLYFKRIEIFQGIDFNKTSEYDICHNWYFLNKNFKFQPYVCNRSYELLILSLKLNDIAILSIKDAHYYYTSEINGNEAINLM